MFKFLLSAFKSIKLFILHGLIPSSMKKRFKEIRSGGIFIGMFRFVWNIFDNIYIIIAIPALIVTYRLIKTLQDEGIIDEFKYILNNVLDTILYISTDCFPMILDLQSMISCIHHA